MEENGARGLKRRNRKRKWIRNKKKTGCLKYKWDNKDDVEREKQEKAKDEENHEKEQKEEEEEGREGKGGKNRLPLEH